MKQIRRHVTYANVMSSFAVFLILGGATAFAAVKKVGPNEIKANSIKTGKIVKEAVKAGKLAKNAVIENKIADGVVTTNKLADNAVTTEKITKDAVTTEKIANGAVNSGKLADESVTEAQIANPLRSRWARVRDNGSLVVGRNVVSSALVGTATYNVTFNSDVSQCGFVPARGTTGFEPSASFIGARGLAGQPNVVRVLTFDNTGTAIGRDFTLLVVC